MRGIALTFAALTALILSGTAPVLAGTSTEAPVQSATDPVGENYLVTIYRGTRETPDSKSAEWRGKQYRQMQGLQGSCMEDLAPQFKNTGKRVAQYGESISRGWFTKDHGPELMRKHAEAIRTAFGKCMQLQVGFAQKLDHQLEGVGVIPSDDVIMDNPYTVPKTN